MHLFEPLALRGVTLANRIVVSPMCQYSAEDGHPGTWHLVHLGSRAVGGAALVFTEATAVEPRGRISPADTGIWSDAHAESWAPIARFIAAHGAVPAMQLAHAGRKASTAPPWDGGKEVPPAAGGWQPVAPSALPFADGYPLPAALTRAEIDGVVEAFAAAAARAVAAGFRVVEIHAAHGYLLHEHLSPLSNHRTDDYGGTFEGRTRLLRRVVERVRASIPDACPLFVRVSATDWVDGGWTLDDTCTLAQSLVDAGVDLLDVSSGGLSPQQRIPLGPGYQTPFAAEVRRRSGLRTGAVGLITSPQQADHVIRTEQADLVFLARELLRDPYWPQRAAGALGAGVAPPRQYARAW
ncbi:MAG: NADH:flavin oxidoreductase/NADH oxidase [Labilithrix sp.]|nr:NADH:flavin oxidoreductase/NADH oxidase [Labilithrix sp.]MCW5812476.1 NADH:flavin oxidoreductase/NADH oxidase [Labilithrix sp.]